MPARMRVDFATVFLTLIVLLGVAVIVVSVDLGFGTTREPGPGLYPFGLGTMMLLLGVLVLRSQLQNPEAGELFPPGGLRRALLIVLALVGWLVLLKLLGYLVVSLLATFAIAKAMGLEGWSRPVGVSVGAALFVYLLFEVWFFTDLPRGILG